MLFFVHLLCKKSHMKQNFDWNDLQAFLAVMRTGKLTAAARLLQVDHTTLGRRISRLEDALKVRLFDRLTVGYRPTAAAEDLLADAEAIESLSAGIYARFTDQVSELTGTIRIAGPEGFGTFFLGPHLDQFQSAYPNLQLELIANPRVVSLSKREAEMAITNIRPTRGSLHAVKLTDYELGVYGSPKYLKKASPIKQKSDLEAHKFIGYIDDMLPTPTHDYLDEISKSIIPDVRISNILTQMAAAKGGAGLCVLPCFMASGQTDLQRLALDDMKITRTYWLVIQSDARQLARVRATADFIINRVQEGRRTFLPGG